MEMIIIKGILCSGLLWLFYFLLLEKGKMHVYNRMYLLFVPFIAIIIPFLSLNISWLPNISSISEWLGFYQLPNETITGNPDKSSRYNLSTWLTGIYLIGVGFFLIRYIKGIFTIMKLIRNNNKIESNRLTYVLIPEKSSSFSFLKYLICNRDEYHNNQIPQAILQHEKVHIEQRHSLDILFIEFIQIIWWFNPFIYLIKSSIRLNHEFLADSYTINSANELTEYQLLLLNQLSRKDHLFTSAFNYSQTKKRILMMNKKENFKRSAWSLAMIFPLAALIFFGFTEVNDREIPPPPAPQEQIAPPPPPVEMAVPEVNSDELNNSIPPPPPPVEMAAPELNSDELKNSIPPPPPPVEMSDESTSEQPAQNY